MVIQVTILLTLLEQSTIKGDESGGLILFLLGLINALILWLNSYC